MTTEYITITYAAGVTLDVARHHAQGLPVIGRASEPRQVGDTIQVDLAVPPDRADSLRDILECHDIVQVLTSPETADATVPIARPMPEAVWRLIRNVGMNPDRFVLHPAERECWRFAGGTPWPRVVSTGDGIWLWRAGPRTGTRINRDAVTTLRLSTEEQALLEALPGTSMSAKLRWAVQRAHKLLPTGPLAHEQGPVARAAEVLDRMAEALWAEQARCDHAVSAQDRAQILMQILARSVAGTTLAGVAEDYQRLAAELRGLL